MGNVNCTSVTYDGSGIAHIKTELRHTALSRIFNAKQLKKTEIEKNIIQQSTLVIPDGWPNTEIFLSVQYSKSSP